MTLPDISVVLDIVIAVLLVATIYYAIRLNRSLTTMKKSKEELQSLLTGFAESTAKAEIAMQRIKFEATDNSLSVKDLIEEADKLREDLRFLVDRGEGVADKLEGGISRNRVDVAADRRPEPLRAPVAELAKAVSGPDAGDGKKKKSRSKSDLLKALQGMR